jgi:hypothetical protein
LIPVVCWHVHFHSLPRQSTHVHSCGGPSMCSIKVNHAARSLSNSKSEGCAWLSRQDSAQGQDAKSSDSCARSHAMRILILHRMRHLNAPKYFRHVNQRSVNKAMLKSVSKTFVLISWLYLCAIPISAVSLQSSSQHVCESMHSHLITCVLLS